MDKQTIRILVVEDDPKWSAIIIDILLRNLADANDGIPRTVFVDGDKKFQNEQDTYIDEKYSLAAQFIEATIISACDASRAKNIIDVIPSLDMVTMDMELIGAQKNDQEKQGMKLLAEVIEHHPEAACLVVSGRADELDVAKNSITRYGAIDAIVKGDNLNEISDSLRATLIYAEAGRLRKTKNMLAARTKAEHGLEVIELMTKNTKANFKRRFEDFLRALDALSVDEISGLLNAHLVIEYASKLLKSDVPWAFGIILLDGLAAFEDTYGSFQRMEVIKIVAIELQKEVNVAIKNDIPQLGYLGEGKFITIARNVADLEAVNKHLHIWFDNISSSLDSSFGDKPKNLLSLRFVLKNSTQGIFALDQLMNLEDEDKSSNTLW